MLSLTWRGNVKELHMFSIPSQYIKPAHSTQHLGVIYYSNFNFENKFFRLVKPVTATLQKLLQLRGSPIDWTVVIVLFSQ